MHKPKPYLTRAIVAAVAVVVIMIGAQVSGLNSGLFRGFVQLNTHAGVNVIAVKYCANAEDDLCDPPSLDLMADLSQGATDNDESFEALGETLKVDVVLYTRAKCIAEEPAFERWVSKAENITPYVKAILHFEVVMVDMLSRRILRDSVIGVRNVEASQWRRYTD